VHGGVASKIKSLEGDYILHKLAHALAGCAAGAAASGDCASGATGAAVGEMVAELYSPANGSYFTDEEKSTLLAASKFSAGAVAAFTGGNAQTAITTAEVAVLNNFCGYKGCVKRRFNWNDAVDHWRNGNGMTVTDVNASELNLTDATYTKNANGTYQIHTSLKFDTGAIYGTVTAVLNGDGTMSIKPDTYNFDGKNPFKADSVMEFSRLVKRDILTGVGLAINGKGSSYIIEFTGSVPVPEAIKESGKK
jgi:hypothetical protein